MFHINIPLYIQFLPGRVERVQYLLDNRECTDALIFHASFKKCSQWLEAQCMYIECHGASYACITFPKQAPIKRSGISKPSSARLNNNDITTWSVPFVRVRVG